MTSTMESPVAAGAGQIEAAPFAVVRRAALPYPDRPAAAEPFRAAVRALTEALRTAASAAPEVADALAASLSDHSTGFHRGVVLPLRRDVHNGRVPRESLLRELGDLPDRVTGLAAWLDAIRDRKNLTALLDAPDGPWQDALDVERAVLAAVCRAEPLRLAVTLTGRDLLHGVDRTAAHAGRPDKRARKAEPTVLRYALRATSKTSPLSWYTMVGLGWWDAAPETPPAAPVAAVQANRVLVSRLMAALLREAQCPHRLAPGLREDGEQVRFYRDVPLSDSSHLYGMTEELVEVGLTGPIRFLIERLRDVPDGLTPGDLAAALAAHIQSADADAMATRYVRKMVEVGLLVPAWPVHTQDPDILHSLAHWCREQDLTEVAARLTAIRDETRAFTGLPPAGRRDSLEALVGEWRLLGERTGADLTGAPVLTEDVTLPAPLGLHARHGRDGVPALTRITPLLMLYDHHLSMRHLMAETFTARYGAGGRAPLTDGATMMSEVWRDLVQGDPRERREPEDMRSARETVAGIIAAANGPEAADVVIPEEAVTAARDLLPGWALARPAAYSVFAQPLPGGLAINHIYAGFARFTSRFLPHLDPSASTAVAGWLRHLLGEDVAQFRPLMGFNANLHPLVLPEEVGEDPRWAGLTLDELEMVHDEDTGLVRIRHRGTGRDLSVLYLGFLVPFVLPYRTAPLTGDLNCGFPALTRFVTKNTVDGVTASGRLTYDGVVLHRRRWAFDDVAAARLREQWATRHPAVAAAHLRADHGLPEHVFIEAGGSAASLEGFLNRLRAAKPQYVDLGNALHLRCLPTYLARYPQEPAFVEALPVPGAAGDGEPVTELIIETCWRPQ
ncbi:lantibiotic dehydratase [Microtetraspora malaysiensis]|uniref:lantibiotic dehydratase n=1 Tax=Microtetraspora malaysiensis TaxID=161358 RepID=UPI003D94A59C